MAARYARAKMMKKLSASISELLNIQKRDDGDEMEDSEGSSGLHKAAMMGNNRLLSVLLGGSCHTEITDSKGMTPLHHAASLANTETAQILLRAGAHIDATCHHGNTALHIACKHGLQDMVSLLLYYRAEPLAQNNEGFTPFDLACEFGRFKTVELLLDSGLSLHKVLCTMSTIPSSASTDIGRCRSGPLSSTKRRSVSSHSLSTSLSANTGKETASGFHLAARNGRLNVVLLLLEGGWPVDRPTHRLQTTALMEAAVNGQLTVVRLLLYAGANSRLTNSLGQTALDQCKRRSFQNNGSGPEVMKEIRHLLRENGRFVHGVATKEFYGSNTDELNFNEGDYIWVTDRSDDRRWRGVIFGPKFNSRSGYFPSDCVEIADRAGGMMQRQPSSSSASRQVKKVAVPSVPTLDATSKAPRSSNIVAGSYGSLDGAATMHHSASTPHQLQRQYNNANGYIEVQHNHQQQQFSNGNYASLASSYAIAPTMQQQTTPHLHYNHQQQPQQLTQIAESPKHRNSTGSNSSQASSGFESMKSASAAHVSSSSASSGLGASLAGSSSGGGVGVGGGDSPPSRNSVHSSSTGTSSSGSLGDSLDERLMLDQHTGGAAINIHEMLMNRVPDDDILFAWLSSFGYEEYAALLLNQGYDLPTVVRMTPEDLTAVGVAKPGHRKRLIAETHRLRIADSWPTRAGNIRDWLQCLGLADYIAMFEQQGYTTVKQVMQLTWEDFEDIGVKKLGHSKKLSLAIKKLKEHRHDGISHSPRFPQAARDTVTIGSLPPNGRTTAEVKPYSHLPSSSAGIDINGLSTFHSQYHDQLPSSASVLPDNSGCSEHYGTFPRRTHQQPQQHPSTPRLGQQQQHVVTAEVYSERPTVSVRPRPVAKIVAKRSSGELPPDVVYSKQGPTFRQSSCENLKQQERITALLDDSDDGDVDGSGILSSPARAGIRLNLHSPGRMLEKCRSAPPPPPPKRLVGSVPPPAPPSTIKFCCADTGSSGRLPTVFSGLSPAPSLDNEEFPPPPSPILCEDSIRSLRTIMNDEPSAMEAACSSTQNGGTSGRNGSGGPSSRSSTSSCETLPFANENCGTIKSREGAMMFSAAAPQSSAGNSNAAPRVNVRDVFANGAQTVSLDATSVGSARTIPRAGITVQQSSTPNSAPIKAVALDDIGSMLQNLTDELDAMLWDPNKRQQQSTSAAATTFTS